MRWLLLLVAFLLTGCAELGYYAHVTAGQLQILAKRQSIDELRQDASTDEALKKRLDYVVSVREYANNHLYLPDNGSFHDYVALQRRHVLWNVLAAPEFSLEPHRWCYPFFGCMNYRNFYSLEKARRYAEELAGEGYDVDIAPVVAYSTLGFFDDPLYSTMLRYSDHDLAGFIFHELAHEQLYIKNDSTFNESFAVTVQLEGIHSWLESRQQQEDFKAYLQEQQRDDEFVKLLMGIRHQLEQLYTTDMDKQKMRQRKSEIFLSLRESYQQLRRQWGGYDAYDKWFRRRINNASLVTVGTYHAFVPAFRRLFKAQQKDFKAFYREARRIGELSETQRQQALEACC